jgi:hypothetical protein
MRKELKQYENVTMLEVIAAAALGAIGGGLLAAVYLYRIGGF